MKLSQLYSNKKFKNITFNSGLNLVLAQVTKKLDVNTDSHNLGKTTLISVLDFMLLKSIDKEHIFKIHKKKFPEYVFYLEILLNSGEFLTIKRSVDNPTKISFKKTIQKTNLLNNLDWDYTDIALAKATTLLDNYLAFDILNQWQYRKSVSYFLRSQKDYNDVFQLSKFSKGQDVQWKPFMFDLLNFNGQLLKDKYQTDGEIKDQKKLIKSIEKKFVIDPNEIDKIKGAIDLSKEEQQKLQTQIDSFNFYQQERKLSKELVEEIEAKVSELNSVEYNLEFDLEKIKQSFSEQISFDIEQLKDLYQEVNIYFPDNLVKSYGQLEEFNRKITEERNKYLKEQIDSLSEQLNSTRKLLSTYNNKRDEMLSILKDKDSFRKFKTYQVELTKIEGDIVRLEEKLKSIDKINLLNEVVEELTEKLQDYVQDIKMQISSKDNKMYSHIRTLFNNIFRYIFNVPALLYIQQNKEGNVDFRVDVTTNNDMVTAENKGNTYQKMLCISFDLSVLVAYHKSSFYRFAYHDGSLEGLDNRKKSNYIKLIREYCEEHNIQYIFTAIEHDIPTEVMSTFSKNEICLTLNDSGDSGKLFEFSF